MLQGKLSTDRFPASISCDLYVGVIFIVAGKEERAVFGEIGIITLTLSVSSSCLLAVMLMDMGLVGTEHDLLLGQGRGERRILDSTI